MSMGFRRLRPEGDGELFERFWQEASENGNAGALKAAFDQDIYRFYGFETGGELAGVGSIHPAPEKDLSHAYILPEHRGERFEDGSLFSYMVDRRIEACTNETWGFTTDATTRHGKTQHVYQKKEFNPTLFRPSDSKNSKPYIRVKKPLTNISEPKTAYTPETVEKLLEEVYTDFKTPETEVGGSEGYSLGFSQGCSQEYPGDFAEFKILEGEQGIEEVLEPLRNCYNNGMNSIRVRMELEDQGTYALTEKLLDEGFKATGVRNPYYGNSDAELYLSRIEETETNFSVTEGSRQFFDSIGLDYRVKGQDRSYTVDVLPTV